MNYIPLIALGLSGIALIISALSFWFSRRAQHHTQIVSFEQQKQEIRRILLEEQVLHGDIKSELDQIPDSHRLRDMISRGAVIRDRTGASIKTFDDIPSSPSTNTRLRLERVGGTIIEAKESLQVLLKTLHDESAALRRDQSTLK
jgi:hypothetical protein